VGAGRGLGGGAAALPALLIALAFLPILALFARDLWSRAHYQFFPLLVPGAAALGWRSCRRLGSLEPGSAGWSLGGAVVAWLLLALAVAVITPWFAAVAALVALLATAHALGGPRLVRPALPAWALLALAIPPPRGFDAAVIAGLQNVVSGWSSVLLDRLGVFHVMEGNVVEVPGRRLLVDQACSGIYSLGTLLSGTLFYALWIRTGLVRGLLLGAAAAFWVILGNVLRVVVVVVLFTSWGVDAASGWRHEVLGLVLFAVMAGLVLSTDCLISFLAALAGWVRLRASRLLGEAPQAVEIAPSRQLLQQAYAATPEPVEAHPVSRPQEPAREPQPAPAPLLAAPSPPAAGPTVLADLSSSWLGSWRVAAAFGVLLLAQAMMPGVDWAALLADDPFGPRFQAVGAGALPVRLGPLERVGFRTEHRDRDNSWGENSRVWSYRSPARSATVSLDHAFVGWHDLTLCYRGQGWRLTGTSLETATPAGGRIGERRIRAEFGNVQGAHGSLLFGLYNRQGRALDPPQTVGRLELLRTRLARWLRRGEPTGLGGEQLSFQLQVFSTSDALPTPAERTALDALYAAALARARGAGSVGGVAARAPAREVAP
jgi:exosortase